MISYRYLKSVSTTAPRLEMKLAESRFERRTCMQSGCPWHNSCMNFENLRVLLVDDFELGRDRLRMGLVEMGFNDKNLIDAENGKVAFDILSTSAKSSTPIDFVFSDWSMPVMTGLELLKACRHDASIKQTKFIMVSSESDRDAIVLALENGADDYLTKPVASADLKQKVDALHARKK
jgi:PleD family two-component response regulator